MDSAVEYHSEQASEFSHQHSLLDENNYFASPFVYGRWRIREALERLLPSVGDGRRLVDIGSGTGEELALYLGAGYDVVGVEPATKMRAEALRRHQELTGRVLDGAGESLPLESASADFILSIEVLRYIQDPVPFGTEVHRVLRPGGSWLFTVSPPTNWTLGAPLNWARCRGLPLPFLQPIRQYWHTVGRLRGLARESRLRLDALLPVNYLDFPGMVLYNLSPRLGAQWARLFHPLWQWMERRHVMGGLAGYYVVGMQKNG